MEAWLANNFPEALSDLNAGCDESVIAEVDEKLGVRLPESLKHVYRLHDEQKTTDLSQVGIFYGVSFLSLKQMLSVWESWADLDRDCDVRLKDSLNKAQISFRPERLKALYMNSKWIPFAIIAESSYLGLDFDPEPEGTVGQVINFGRDEEQKTVLANSFGEFLEWYVSELERGNFVIVNDRGWTEFLPKDLSPRVLETGSPYLGEVATRFIQ